MERLRFSPIFLARRIPSTLHWTSSELFSFFFPFSYSIPIVLTFKTSLAIFASFRFHLNSEIEGRLVLSHESNRKKFIDPSRRHMYLSFFSRQQKERHYDSRGICVGMCKTLLHLGPTGGRVAFDPAVARNREKEEKETPELLYA